MGGKRGIASLALVLCLLVGCDGQLPGNSPAVQEKTEGAQQPAIVLTFPVSQPDSGLVAEQLQPYSGPYWEDGSGEEVKDVAGLLICNPTDRMVEFAAFSVEQAGEQLYFFAYRLPPQSRCLVLEYGRKSCNPQSITACQELCVRWGTQEMSREQIDYVGLGPMLTVINRDDRQLGHVTVWYKRYDQEGEYYLGGAAFSVHVLLLLPEERRAVMPEHYDAGHARIVGVDVTV